MYDNNNRQKDFIMGALVGSTVAVLTSLLFTTRKGKQIQRSIAEAYEDIEEGISDRFSDVKDRFEDGVETLQQKASDVKDRFQEGVGSFQRKASNAKDKAEEEADNLSKKLKNKVEETEHNHSKKY